MDSHLPCTLASTEISTDSKIKRIFDEGTSDNTRLAYKKDLDYFTAWLHAYLPQQPLNRITPEILCKFITDHLVQMPSEIDEHLLRQGFKNKPGLHSIATVRRRISSVSMFHKIGSLPNPCESSQVSQLLSKAKRRSSKQGFRPNKKKAITADKLRVMLETCDNSLTGIRDRAILLFAFCSGGRRASEVASAEIKNLESFGDNYIYTITFSKTDQSGQGHQVPLKGEAASALRDWLSASNVSDGKIFRAFTKHQTIRESISVKSVSLIVKARAELAGFDSSKFSSHSLRSGFVTESGRQQIALADTMALTGHKTTSVAVSYHQAGAVLNNPASEIF